MPTQTPSVSESPEKSQPWKAFWPPQDGIATQTKLTAEEMNLQRSYGTHASNTKGKIFAIDNKSKGKLFLLLYFVPGLTYTILAK